MKMKREEERAKSNNVSISDATVAASASTATSNGCSEIGKTMVVGVKLDTSSRELLTWSLVKVAQTGDRIIALHVLPYFTTELRDGAGQSSLISLVKAFESVLTVYEGFCNLKQVDLKLKICRGSSVRRVLVREAKSLQATKVIVGIAKSRHSIRSSTSIAKYCARKLPPYCWVLAVNNGKIVFERDSTDTAVSSESGKRTDSCRPRTAKLLSAIQWTWSKNSKVINGRRSEHSVITDGMNKENEDWDDHRSSVAGSTYSESDCSSIVGDDGFSNISSYQTCSICAPNSVRLEELHCTESTEEATGDSSALVPLQTFEAASSSISLLIREVPELRPGWPVVRRAILPNRQSMKKSMAKEISVVQWKMRLQAQHSVASVQPDHQEAKSDSMTKESDSDGQNEGSNLDGENGAIVPLGSADSCTVDDNGSRNMPKDLESLQEKYSSTCRLFSYQELVTATSNFSSDKLIGKGGSSQVYKGCLPDGKELAVKILKPSEDALKEFVSEIEIITTLHHKNIISLFGFCFEDNKLLLVYDLLSRGSLEENLHGKKDQRVLSWDERYKVAVGVAGALDYLHCKCSQSVIHRDVKSSNILLSDDFEPQLSDFGLATWASTSSYITCSDVAGTFGYLAPEYFMYGKVNEKIDVYAFGVVLLELLSGRKPISSEYPKGQESLVMWAKPILQSGKAMRLLDPSLGDRYNNDQMEKMVLAASLCIRRAPRFRPRMSHIFKLLQGDDEVNKWARLQVSASEGLDGLDDETYPPPNIQSHLNLALLDVEDDSLSVSSTEPSLNYLTANKSMEDYLQGRCSRSSSFD